MRTVSRGDVKKSNAASRRVGRLAPETKSVRRKKPATQQLLPPSTNLPNIRVRMYRQGLGDCFLLTFNLGREETHILIDCGTLGSKTTDVKLPDVIADIDKTTNGRLHLVVATHQHQDHLSGFPQLSDLFSSANQKQIDNVWLAWTEDPEDPDAQELTKARDDMAIAVKTAAQALQTTDRNSETAEAMESLLGFFGVNSVIPSPSGRADAVMFAAAARTSMDIARGLAKKPAYLSPGEPPIEPDWLPGFRFYVLGPPRDINAIHDTGAHGSSELYGLTALVRSLGRGSSWFYGHSRLSIEDASTENAFRNYFDPAESWRRIDNDWVNAASSLAIHLDKFTNNTSLVIAIERIADGKVLLFPGDAQEGNWLLWQGPTIQWQVKTPDAKTATITAKELLSRTVFYKVGHHSSQNATAKAKGLEMMTSESELTAFIPVDRQVALGRSPAGTWKMPARQLYRRLLDKCQGRVVRSDIGWAANVKQGTKGTEAEFIALGTDAEWAAWTKSQQAATRVQIEANHIDFMLE